MEEEGSLSSQGGEGVWDVTVPQMRKVGSASPKPAFIQHNAGGMGLMWLVKRQEWVLFSVLLWFLGSGMAVAATSPAKVVQQFIDAHLQGRFAEARGFALEQANLRGSLFSNWLFGARGLGGDAATADVFLSRKFAQAFRYNIMGSTPSGNNQLYVTAKRTSPNLAHLYTWALAPKQGASPYELINAIDDYLTKVNFPVEESRMQFTLIREAGEWYISAVHDEKFVQLQQQWLSQQPPIAVASPPGGAALPAPGPGASTPAAATTTSSNDAGRQMADAQFNATLQSFNRTYQPPASVKAPPAKPEEDKPSFLGKVGRLFGIGRKKDTGFQTTDARLKEAFNNIRDALARYTVTNGDTVPATSEIYDWQSLRRIVNRHGKKSLPATEAEAGFTFVRYRADLGVGDYVLVLELHEPQNGAKHVEVTPYGVDRAG